MKASTEKSATTTSTTATQTTQEPFFGKKGGDGFFESAPQGNAPFIQAKLTINQPGDVYEQEADRVADQVVQRLAMPSPEPVSPLLSTAGRSPAPIQTKCADCEQEEQVQRKEEEGPEESETIMRKEESASASQPPADIQAKCADCEQEEQVQRKEEQGLEEPEEIMRQAESASPAGEAGSDFSTRLQSSKGGGSPLPDNTRTDMESALGTDLSGVRIHTGGEAADMSKSINAQAFTHGSDVYFNDGKFDAGSTDGKRLLAHELVHVGQQGGGKTVSNLQLKEQKSLADEIPDLHIIYEFIAHHVVYEKEEYLKGENDVNKYNEYQKVLWKAGFDPKPKNSIFVKNHKGDEADAFIIFPRQDAYNEKKGTKDEIIPILAFRGTELDNMATDADLAQVGASLYAKHEKKINELLEFVEKADIVGHSLGGALAQIATARNPGKVRNLVTFQSPGISQAEVEKYKKTKGNEMPNVFHHIVNNDVVDLGGEENIPGTFYEHSLTPYINQIDAHQAFVFATDSFKKRRTDLYGLTNDLLSNEHKMNKKIYTGNPEISKYQQYPHPEKRKRAEKIRKKVGKLRDSLIDMIPKSK